MIFQPSHNYLNKFHFQWHIASMIFPLTLLVRSFLFIFFSRVDHDLLLGYGIRIRARDQVHH